MRSQMFLHVGCATFDPPSEQFPAMLANALISNFTGQEVQPNFGSTEIGYVFVIVVNMRTNVSIILFYFILFVILQDRK